MRILIVMFAAALWLAPSTAAAATTKTFHTQHQSSGNYTFIGDFSRARAIVSVQDTGTSLVVNGRADGFDLGLQFISLIYDTGSVQSGALACIPTTPNPFTPSQMFVGYWYPSTARVRVLSASNTSYVPVVKTGAAYVPIAQIATMSIRYDSTPTLSPLINQNPGRFWLQACGSVR